jgi:hypothetical protein
MTPAREETVGNPEQEGCTKYWERESLFKSRLVFRMCLVWISVRILALFADFVHGFVQSLLTCLHSTSD